MKILWASPYCHQSAIARFSAGVVAELRARGHEVAVLRIETGDAAGFDPIADPLVLQAGAYETAEWLRTADIVFANIGDHYGFHGGVFDLIESRKVVGILHDWCLLGLFWGWLVAHDQTDRAGHRIAQLYGEDARHAYERADASSMLETAAELFPMTEWACGQLLAAVIHSEFYRHRVEAGCAGPVARIPLAYPAPDVPVRTAPHALPPPSVVRVRTIGVVNRNKCVDQLIEAIGGDAWLREHMEYSVLGHVADDERKRLEQLAARLGYQGLTLEGSVTQARLLEGLAEADIVCCLRSPALEGASASAIEGMQSGAPVMVTNAGFYAELPDGLVLKVPEGAGPPKLREQLRMLAEDPEKRHAMGTAARHWAAQEFSAASYARRLEAHLADFVSAEPYVLLATALGKELGRMGLPPEDAAFARVSAVIAGAFSLD